MEFELSPPEFDDKSFSGVARLFPLPAVSLFPGIVLPLHVFEERYRALVEDAIDSDGLIAMATLKPGWEPDYAGRPPIDSTVCLGQIVTYHRLPDGKYNLFLAGVRRARVVKEIEPPLAFRRAEVQLLPEAHHAQSVALLEDTMKRLSHAFRESLPVGSIPDALERVFEEGVTLGQLSDLAAYTLPLEARFKRELLAEPDALKRAKRLIEVLEQGDGPQPMEGPFPPSPSEN